MHSNTFDVIRHALFLFFVWSILAGRASQDLKTFHKDVSKLLDDIDRPINDDELSDTDENELLVRRRYFLTRLSICQLHSFLG
jgi:hypothetical protein